MILNSKKSRISVALKTNYKKSDEGYFEPSASYNENKDDNDVFDNDEEELYYDILGHRKSSYEITEVKEQNAIKLVCEKNAYCFDVKLFAEKFVEAIFIEANKKLTQDEETVPFPASPASQSGEITDLYDQKETSEKHIKVKFKNILTETCASYWPKISEFNIKLGLEKIQNYVNRWERSDDWKFCVEFLGFECEDCSNIFVYEVEWSKPTKSYPIPQATASVYFAMEVYKMVPHNYDRCIEVTYIFECSSVIHHPGKIDFQEKWLEDIIEAKLNFFKTITFSSRVF